ncbi:PKD domain-containing protein [Streptomyces toxytricini]|uniref:PKD domain-containing protein n=1 Tax=Streptomyces toxytricini TaxID=67369 RepID=A0ABW8EK45_STRT5
MRPTRATVLLTAGLVTLLGVPSAAAAETPPTLYVNNNSSSCSDGGSGSQAVPFCSISAAAKVVAPGQTVRIKTGKRYDEAVTIDRSGTPGKPVSFVSDGPEDRLVVLGTQPLTITGASHVVVRGLSLSGGIRVNRSADVELDRVYAHARVSGAEGLVVGDASTDVRVSRGLFHGVRIEGGAQRTVLGRNEIIGNSREPLTVEDAPATVITNNTFQLGCGTAVPLSGSSSGSAVFNNVINAKYYVGLCDPARGRTALAVSQSAAAGTRADYNLIAGPFQTVYTWGGAAHQDQAAFHAATGQGGHDIVHPTTEDAHKKAVDSADATAPGVMPTDISGYPVVDDLRVPNTGKDGGYLDRGARESQNSLESVRLELDQPWAPAGTAVKATATAVSAWSGPLTYHFDFGDGSAPVVTGERTATHVYSSPCECTAKVTVYNEAKMKTAAGAKVKVTAPGPLTAGFTSQPFLPTAEDPRAYVAPLTVEVDPRSTVAPWPVQQVDVDFGDGAHERVSALEPVRHAYAQPGDHKVTVTLKDAKGATSTVSRTVQVAYAASGYVPVHPFRVLDTRLSNSPVQAGTAAQVAVPMIAGSPSGSYHTGGATAAVLNVTVTGATQDTHLNVWPSGQQRPATSNVNVRAGGTSSNTVTVPIGSDGKILAQLNSGQGHVVVDFVGYYQPNTGKRFYPVTPTRLADTRTTGGALGAGQTRTVKVAGVRSIPPDAQAVALNLTGTGATTDTHVIAYAEADKRPAISNLNPEPGKDKSNQVIVPVGPDGTITLYNNAGSTDLVLDVVGYYHEWGGGALFTPVVPKRLADTRTTGKLAPGATTTVAGLPANAVGAALNVTATETTSAGFLTVHGYGTARTDASSLNTRPGETVPNHVTTPVGGGKVSIWNSWGGSNHVITDVFGYFTQG